jgi:DNA-binding NarL/FixJ family response regulator
MDAREPLERALQTFRSLGAEPWARRAADELAAAGGTRPSEGVPRTRDELSAHELKVALMVAHGMTNREVAAALFLSPKTIERHLSRIYRKLDVRSRTELARLLAADS